MSYLVQIEDSAQSEGLLQYLKTLNYVRIIDDRKFENSLKDKTFPNLYSQDDSQIDIRKFNQIINLAEQSNNIPLDEAISQSKKWKNIRK